MTATNPAVVLVSRVVVASVVAVAVVTVVVVVALEVAMAVSVPRPATAAEASATCHATARKDRSATTVRLKLSRVLEIPLTRLSGGETGHLSRDCPAEQSNERVCYRCKQAGHLQSQCPN